MDLHETVPLNHRLIHASSWSHAKSRALDIIEKHPLNQQLEVFLPTLTPGAVGSLSRQGGFYYSMHISPRELVDECLAHPERHYYAILKNAPQDGANTLNLFPNGDLLLSLDHDTYTQFGLVGHHPTLPPALKSVKSVHGKTYVITISLLKLDKSSSFGERVLTCLDRFGPTDMWICATNDAGDALTIAITHDSAQRNRIELAGSVHPFDSIRIPSVSHASANQEHIEDVFEWLGVMACRIESLLQGDTPDDYVSSFTLPMLENSSPMTATSVRWRGLIPEAFCNNAVQFAREQVKSKRVPWAAVLVWGFSDALVSWWQDGKRRDHGFQVEGSNNYSIVCLPDNQYWLIQSIAAHDTTD
ncbi:unnamed protein product [Aphanomyces euteiches]|uniref:Uncharacterized protein n=1 Tax=Aphanomyces euteiches TaxID=100861 RepID=A0A6G0WGM5_9STRA|nr:hypothetical protein Ae201684_015413 [Aphanomyces euteiches]KAH9097637.1 hypothetical protein Ae201684P_001113 [Aphanomyces euteiches]KAH9146638.1 hypothetical protein AeRB84_009508 [Aphanomyces euteiches]